MICFRLAQFLVERSSDLHFCCAPCSRSAAAWIQALLFGLIAVTAGFDIPAEYSSLRAHACARLSSVRFLIVPVSV
jgi:hypothetical protein